MSANGDPQPADEPVEPREESDARARALLVVAGAVVAVQAGALVLFAALELASIESDRVGLAVSTAVFFAALGLLLLFAVASIIRFRAWARGLLVFSQLLCLALSFNFRGDAWWITPTLAVPALVALGCLVSSPVTRALGRHDAV